MREGLTDYRGAEVDESQPETQPSGFLDDLVRVICTICHDKFASDMALYGNMEYVIPLSSLISLCLN